MKKRHESHLHFVVLTIFGILIMGEVRVTDILPKYQDYHELKDLLGEKKLESLYISCCIAVSNAASISVNRKWHSLDEIIIF